MARTIALISCGKQKLVGRHAAKDLYKSPRFKYALEYANNAFDSVYILSGYYGLVKPNTRLQSYNTALTDMPIDERRAWARRVVRQIRTNISRGSRLHFLCPKAYREPLAELLCLDGYACFAPLEGRNRGEQIAWLKHAAEQTR